MKLGKNKIRRLQLGGSETRQQADSKRRRTREKENKGIWGQENRKTDNRK